MIITQIACCRAYCRARRRRSRFRFPLDDDKWQSAAKWGKWTPRTTTRTLPAPSGLGGAGAAGPARSAAGLHQLLAHSQRFAPAGEYSCYDETDKHRPGEATAGDGTGPGNHGPGSERGSRGQEPASLVSV